jgi:hypothetical protein
MSRNIKFLVIDGSTTTASGFGIVIAGRCYDGPIYPGDIFSEAREGDISRPIHLTVENISSYGRIMDQIDPTVTGQLVLSGGLSKPIPDHAIISGKSYRDITEGAEG